jgi:hypothetical protein
VELRDLQARAQKQISALKILFSEKVGRSCSGMTLAWLSVLRAACCLLPAIITMVIVAGPWCSSVWGLSPHLLPGAAAQVRESANLMRGLELANGMLLAVKGELGEVQEVRVALEEALEEKERLNEALAGRVQVGGLHTQSCAEPLAAWQG